MLTAWYEALAPPSPIPLDLLAEPAAVVHAVRLRAARHWGVPLDEVWLDSRAKPEEDDDQSDLDSFKGDEVSRSRASTPASSRPASRAATPGDDLVDEAMPEEMPKLVVSITGMTIEGARWDQFAPDGGALRECERIDGPFDPAPVVSLIPLAREAFFDEDEEDVSREDDENATIAEVLRLLLSAVLVVLVGSLIVVEDGDEEVEAPRTCLVDAGVEQQRAAMEDMFNKYIHARELRRNDRSTADVCAFVRSLLSLIHI